MTIIVQGGFHGRPAKEFPARLATLASGEEAAFVSAEILDAIGTYMCGVPDCKCRPVVVVTDEAGTERALELERKPGRPATLKGAQRVNTTLDAETIAGAQQLGNGNLSEGLRRAVEIALRTVT